MTPRTPSQTVGPFFSLGLTVRPQNELPDGSVRLEGRVLDGAGDPVPDALVEVWHPEVGFGRCGTDGDGRYAFLLPSATRRLEVMVFARGLLKPVVTRIVVPGEAGAEDATMLAQRADGGLRFDVHLQGERETAFFEL
jgi:protocatechuate 3,4-dioxygenase, alpha subunit